MKRFSKQRNTILEELKNRYDHPGADEIFSAVKKKLPSISLGTVYRNLEQLAAAGLIKKINTGGGQKRFDGKSESHVHFRCTRCNSLEDIPMEIQIPSLDPGHPFVKERTLFYSDLEYHGLCHSCTKKAKAEADKDKDLN